MSRNRSQFFVFPFLLLLFFSCSRNNGLELYEFKGQTMGTFYSIKIVEDGSNLNQTKISAKIKELLTAVNQTMSTYIDSSELSLLNQYKEKDWKEISPELYTVLKEADQISRLSNGAFDITVGPLVNLWGFGTEGNKRHQPDMEQITKRKKRIGYQNLLLKENPYSAQKKIPDLYCDLSGIAKGYGVDVVADYFDSVGINNYLVEVGGEIRARGKNLSFNDWRIGVQSPNAEQGIFCAISVSNRALATSGDYQNYFEENGVRFSHTIDPVTGKPISHKLASVTVVHELCMTADAFATAINVLGPEKGLALAKEQELAVFLIVREQNGFVEKMTPQFESLMSK